nr:hypothetical protein [uncultured Duganella sp.]
MSALANNKAPASGAALRDLVEEVADAADDLSCTVETAKDLLSLALKELEADTTTRAGSAIRGAKLFMVQLDDMVARLHSLSRDAKGASA